MILVQRKRRVLYVYVWEEREKRRETQNRLDRMGTQWSTQEEEDVYSQVK